MSFFLSATIGSSLLGIALGLVVVRWLRSANRPLKSTDSIIQISITIVSAYLIFYFAQYTLQISGVLACCGAGLMLAWLGPPIILSHESMHNVWSIIEWIGLLFLLILLVFELLLIGNTLIFLLAGLIIGHRTLGHVNTTDWFYVILLYLVLLCIRMIVITAMFPFLSNKSHKFNFNEAIFVSWAGLRGALSMALALIVENSSTSNSDSSGNSVSSKETSRLLFYVGGIAALTLIINATTAKAVLTYFKLIDDNTIEKQLVVGQIKRRLRKKMNKLIEKMTTTTISNTISNTNLNTNPSSQQMKLNYREIDEIRQSMTLFRMEDLYRDTTVVRETIAGMGRESFNNKNKNKTVNESFNIAENKDVTINRINSNRAFLPPLPDRTERFHGTGSIDSIDDDTESQINNPQVIKSGRKSFQGSHNRSQSLASQNSENSRFFQTIRSVFDFNSSAHNNLQTDRASNLSRLLSHHQDRPGGLNSVIIPDLLAYVRAIFLEIVRVKYWNLIEGGKLPRLSHSAQFLLYSG